MLQNVKRKILILSLLFVFTNLFVFFVTANKSLASTCNPRFGYCPPSSTQTPPTSTGSTTPTSSGSTSAAITCNYLENHYSTFGQYNSSTDTSANQIATIDINGSTWSNCNPPNLNISISQSSTQILAANDGYVSTCSGNGRFGFCPSQISFYVYNPPSSGSGASNPPYSVSKACGVDSSNASNPSSNASLCVSCLRKNIGNQSFQYIYTDFGCVNTTPSGLINFIYVLAIVISSMLAFLTLLIGGFLIMTSSGDPDKVNRGKTLVRNAIIGLIVIILAVVILGLIGSIFNISQIAL